MGKNPFLTEDLAWHKIKHYCKYQERCHFEAKNKLFSLGLDRKTVEILVSRLIEEGILNEERFAKNFAGGHFRQKRWGKMKIADALRQKRISAPVIKIALKEIEDEGYTDMLNKLAVSKWNSLKGEQYLARQVKTRAYLLQKGYETGAIQSTLIHLLKRSDI